MIPKIGDVIKFRKNDGTNMVAMIGDYGRAHQKGLEQKTYKVNIPPQTDYRYNVFKDEVIEVLPQKDYPEYYL